MSKFLKHILGINIPTIDEIKEQAVNLDNDKADEFLMYITFVLTADGTIKVKTEWAEESDNFAQLYAQLLYHINSGTTEEGLITNLIQFGEKDIKSQKFIVNILNKYEDLRKKYKNMPLISPLQLKVQK